MFPIFFLPFTSEEISRAVFSNVNLLSIFLLLPGKVTGYFLSEEQSCSEEENKIKTKQKEKRKEL